MFMTISQAVQWYQQQVHVILISTPSACERFLRSWLTWGELLSDDLTTGLLTLWSLLKPQA